MPEHYAKPTGDKLLLQELILSVNHTISNNNLPQLTTGQSLCRNTILYPNRLTPNVTVVENNIM